jgi:tyrosyl-tRNA synthetase
MKLIDLLVNSGICSSRREAREMLGNNAISLNNVRHNDENEVITRELAIDQRVIIVRKGKKKQYICLFD